MKTYLIRAEIYAYLEAPYYVFMIKTNNRNEAIKKAKKIIKEDYTGIGRKSKNILIKKIKNIYDIEHVLLVN